MIAPDKSDQIKILEKRVRSLIRDKDLAMSALETAVSISALHGGDTDPHSFLGSVLEHLESVLPSLASGFFMVDEETSDFVLRSFRPAASGDRIQQEMDALVKDRMFSYAVQRRTPVVVSSMDRSCQLVLQSVATASRIRGMFLAVLENDAAIADTILALLPVLLISTANSMESLETYRYIQSVNATLEATIERLEASEQQLMSHGKQLAKEVANRTCDLTRANEQLTEEVSERRKAQQALSLERDYITAVLDTAGALILVMDSNHTVLRCNSTCSEYFCTCGEKCGGARFLEFFVPEDVDHVRDRLRAVSQSLDGSARELFEATIVDDNGSRHTLSWSCSALPGPVGEPRQLIVSGIDISEKILAEQALRDSEARFRAVFMSAGLGIVLGGLDGVFIDANPAFCAMMGYSREEIPGLTIFDLTKPEDHGPDFHARLQRLLDDEISTLTSEKQYIRKDGSWVWGQSTLSCIRTMDGGTSYLIGMISDTSERKVLEEALRAAESTYRNIFENAVEGIFLAPVDGPYLRVNPAMAAIFGYSSPESIVQDVSSAMEQLFPDPETRAKCFHSLQEDGTVRHFESRTRGRNGEAIWISISARALSDASGAVVSLEGLAEDITERKAREQQLKRLATIDELTSIPNRHLFLDRFAEMIEQSSRLGLSIALLYIDLDDFKLVNDNHGHHIGDKVLSLAAERLRHRVRKTDIVARLGGDEFCVLISNPATGADVQAAATHIIATLSAPYTFEDFTCHIGVSIGIAMFPGDGDSSDELLRKADAAMYVAKRSGGNSFAVYTQDDDNAWG
ncbi:sensor domain-containing protein [Oceanidesulfovibrio marinus]|uniref:PAS domain S-box protein n=1 Tax=Oceanidesulfovibrio marinus TaxID=370038 RepID=A0ABX6NFA0_9BACT|nr:sensor domain-containing diguanylate cyclase [Oceanidesulfovibrio marinus]QJT09287.1 PAS domain S-box protein [Oceanidesulfovibrio marinus]